MPHAVTFMNLDADYHAGPEVPLVLGVTDYFKKCTLSGIS